MRITLSILVTGLLVGCVGSPGQNKHMLHPSQQVLEPPRLGMSPEQVRTNLSGLWLLMSASRPIPGWSTNYHIDAPAGWLARKYEFLHGVAVQRCDVYWEHSTWSRSYHGPWYYGIWLHGFYFDIQDRLTGFDRSVRD
jgi:hypothetical protein